jgi:CHASE2 domain-containing sensor protein
MINAIISARSRARAWIKTLSPFGQRLGRNILVGLVVYVVVVLFDATRIGVSLQNWALDLTMQGYAGYVASYPAPPAGLPRFAFIDVDEETWRSPHWGKGEPYRAPRDGLLQLVNYAILQKAKFIVLDVVVDGRAETEDSDFGVSIEHSVVPRLEKGDQHLLFVRSLRNPLYADAKQLVAELRPSEALDQVIHDHPTHLHNVAPYYQVSRDGLVRAWRIWRAGCRRDTKLGSGHWEVLPSVQLEIAFLQLPLKEQSKATPWSGTADSEPCLVDLNAVYERGVTAPEEQIDQLAWIWLRAQQRLTHHWYLEEPTVQGIDLSSRIFFKYRDPPHSFQVRVIPALSLLPKDPPALAKDPPALDLSGGVVVIGQSSEEAHDLHATPLGVMSGPLVIINSVDSMLSRGLIRRPYVVFAVGIELFLIVLVGMLFAWSKLDQLAGTLIAAVSLFVALLLVNYLLIQLGFWIDFGIPLVGIALHRVIDKSQEYVQEVLHLGPHKNQQAKE